MTTRKPRLPRLERATLASRIGRVVREERERKRMTQDEIGRAIGCSQARISTLESGRSRMSVAELEELAKALGMPVTSIVYAAETTPRSAE